VKIFILHGLLIKEVISNTMKQHVAALSMALVIAVVAMGILPVAAEISVMRDLQDTPVWPKDLIVVNLTQSGFYLNFGSVNELLPDGFMYIPGSIKGEASLISYDETGNELKIQFENATSVSYMVGAGTSDQIANARFSGTYWFRDVDLKVIEGAIEGDETLTLGTGPKPTSTPTSTTNGGGGNGGGTTSTPSATTSPGVSPSPSLSPGVTTTPVVSPTSSPGVTSPEPSTVTPPGTPTSEPVTSPHEGIPGFEAGYVISGLLMVAYLVLRQGRGKRA
jgi:hypothetical protein